MRLARRKASEMTVTPNVSLHVQTNFVKNQKSFSKTIDQDYAPLSFKERLRLGFSNQSNAVFLTSF